MCYLCRSDRHRRNSIDFGFYLFGQTQRLGFRNSAFRTATRQAVKTICNIYLLLLLWTIEWSIWNTELHCIWLVTKAEELCTLTACLCTSSVSVVSSILEIDWNLNFMSSHIWVSFWTRFLCITNKNKFIPLVALRYATINESAENLERNVCLRFSSTINRWHNFFVKAICDFSGTAFYVLHILAMSVNAVPREIALIAICGAVICIDHDWIYFVLCIFRQFGTRHDKCRKHRALDWDRINH